MHEIEIASEVLGNWRKREGIDRAERATRFSPFVGYRTALVAIDMQNAFTVPGQPRYCPGAESIIPNINRLARAVRRVGGLVVWVKQTFDVERKYAVPTWREEAFPRIHRDLARITARGSHGYKLNPALDVDQRDVELDKSRWGAMMPNSSNLHERLQASGIEIFIAVGCASDVCVETTVREAAMLDYKTIFVSDATATIDSISHNAAIRGLNNCVIVDILTTNDVVNELTYE